MKKNMGGRNQVRIYIAHAGYFALNNPNIAHNMKSIKCYIVTGTMGDRISLCWGRTFT